LNFVQLGQLLRIRALGPWNSARVKCARGESSFAPPAIVRAEIEQVWSVMSQKPGVHLFDGRMCRLESFAADDGELQMVLSETSYKSFAGTNMHNPQFGTQYGEAAMANPLGISVALISGDGFLVLGRRNERVAYYPGRIHPFAGALEPEDGMDVFGAIRRELAEELNLGEPALAQLTCLGMAEDRGLVQPELICYAEVEKILDELRGEVDEVEHDAIVPIAVSPDVFERELASAKLYTPIALATILLCGRERFGNGWFDATFAA
jgi:8-oxo-dGTP pyrophosphatase MutT (NUDIX family)